MISSRSPALKMRGSATSNLLGLIFFVCLLTITLGAMGIHYGLIASSACLIFWAIVRAWFPLLVAALLAATAWLMSLGGEFLSLFSIFGGVL